MRDGLNTRKRSKFPNHGPIPGYKLWFPHSKSEPQFWVPLMRSQSGSQFNASHVGPRRSHLDPRFGYPMLFPDGPILGYMAWKQAFGMKSLSHVPDHGVRPANGLFGPGPGPWVPGSWVFIPHLVPGPRLASKV